MKLSLIIAFSILVSLVSIGIYEEVQIDAAKTAQK